MIEISQTLTNNVEYFYSITEIPEINTDSAYIYDVSCNGIPTVTKVDQTTFKMIFNTESVEFNTTVKLKINGIYGYDDWSSNMVGNENTLQIQVKFNITRGISPFVLQNTSNSAKTITLDYDGVHAQEDFDMWAGIGAIEGSYSHYTWETGSTKQFSFTIPAGQNLYLYSMNMSSMGYCSTDSYTGVTTLNFAYNIVKFGGNFTGIKFGGSIYALTNNNVSSVALFYGLFEGCNITTAPALPATQISEIAYAKMFKSCTSLTTAPALPATSVPAWCYQSMFKGCTSLTAAPSSISVKNASFYSLESMFEGCTSLASAPNLNFTTVSTYSCRYMFRYCTSLTTMPNVSISDEISARDNIGHFYGMFQGCTSLTTLKALSCDYVGYSGYAHMFEGCASLTALPNNMLPATHIDDSCYSGMFKDCAGLSELRSNLLSAVTNLYNENSCYASMFQGCTSLTTIPSGFLPATTLERNCYASMFQGCTSLTTIPSNLLPASTLKYSCYQSMFAQCTSLTTIPNGLLNGSTLAETCYKWMFKGCTSLRTVPQYLLSAENCATGCYYGMFEGCTSLVTPPELRATQIADECYKEMFKNCSSLTSVYCRAITSNVNGFCDYLKYDASYTGVAYPAARSGYRDSCPIVDNNNHVIGTVYEYGNAPMTRNSFKDWLNGVSNSGAISIKFNVLTCQLFGRGTVNAQNPYGSMFFPSGWSLVFI